MKTVAVIASVAFGTLCVRDVSAQARERGNWWSDGVPPITQAVELSVATGYTQGFGGTSAIAAMPSADRPAIAVEPGLGIRLDDRWAFGLVLQYAELTVKDSSDAFGISGGILVTRHFEPARRLDPWIDVSSGYRALWDLPATETTTVTRGFQLARARIGLDLRIDNNITVAPFLGADASLFVWRDAIASAAVVDPRFATFVFAGFQSRAHLGF
jgi:hypothetical protein